jgi:hypothetical protein
MGLVVWPQAGFIRLNEPHVGPNWNEGNWQISRFALSRLVAWDSHRYTETSI